MVVNSTPAAKAAAAKAAITLIQSGMRIGLGTGSTVVFLLELLGKRCQEEGLIITCLASSKATAAQAQALGIPIADDQSLIELDLTIDGADEVDDAKRLIKGGGGALLREKILAHMAKEMVVIVDETKCSATLNRAPLPIEVLPFAANATLYQIEHEIGLPVTLRLTPTKEVFTTDNNNYILDLTLPSTPFSPEDLDLQLKNLPGVLATGFFLHMAGRIFVGHSDGTHHIINS